MSIFQNNTLEVDNPQSREEDEELEEQRRRQEELTDLLAAGIDEYNYEDSTINSSLTSVETAPSKHPHVGTINDQTSLENLSTHSSTILRNYQTANQEEQLKILYDVRVREINKLKAEFSQFSEEKLKEINLLKNKAIVAEAEAHHAQEILKNSESLLVEKNEIIRNLNQNLMCKDKDITDLKKILEEQNLEICTYKSTVNELQLKLADTNPFNSGAHKLNFGELHKVNQEQIAKLETLLQEQHKKTEIIEKEKNALDEDLQNLLRSKKEVEEENNLTIMGLSKKLQNTQQQCKELFILGEAIKRESDHFKERLQQLESNNLNMSREASSVENLDKNSMMVHLEKLKKMLLDKDVELNTLKAKLRFYNSEVKEFFEYQHLLCTMYTSEVKSCSNNEHTELIIFLQRQLQSYQQGVEDRNNQIIHLNSVNKELQDKIEETIQQTRTDIQNISQKYSLPQLETMSTELKIAEETIKSLKEKLAENDHVGEELHKISQEKDSLQQLLIRERINFEQTLKEVHNELKNINEEKNKLFTELTESGLQLEEINMQLQKICLKLGVSEANIFETEADVHRVKSKYDNINDHLQHILLHLETMNLKRTNFNIIFTLKKQIESYISVFNKQNANQHAIQEKLEQWDNMLSDFIEVLNHSVDENNIDDTINVKTVLEGEKATLAYQLAGVNDELEDARKTIAQLKASNKSLEKNSPVVEKLNEQIRNLKLCLEAVDGNKLELEKQLENTQIQLNEAKQEIINLQKEIHEAKRNLVKELENNVETTNDNVLDDTILKKCQTTDILNMEILLRDHFQKENIKKMQKFEDEYKAVIAEKLEKYSKMEEKWKLQEANYRKQFSQILEECGKKIQELENENFQLQKQNNALFEEYKIFKSNVVSIEKYHQLVATFKKTVQDLNNQWTSILEDYMINTTKMEKQHKKIVKNTTQKLNLGQTEINLLEHLFEEKIKKFKAEKANKSTTMKNVK